MKVGKRLTWPVSEEQLNDILTCLQAAHEMKIMHCDLRAENILLIEGRATLIDFGLSCKFDNAHKYVISKGTNQSKRVGSRIRRILDSAADSIHLVNTGWRSSDDYEMLAKLMYNNGGTSTQVLSRDYASSSITLNFVFIFRL